jgi:hypothetical protein
MLKSLARRSADLAIQIAKLSGELEEVHGKLYDNQNEKDRDNNANKQNRSEIQIIGLWHCFSFLL